MDTLYTSDDKRQELCLKIQGYGLFDSEIWNYKLDWIIGFSAIMNLCVAFSIFVPKKLNVHPAGLIGL
jgi:hypothetical protein